jgi:Glycosyl transferases group 1/Glycosyl transferase 4-like domain
LSQILQINSFPTLLPTHGGQRRAHHIGRMLEWAGHKVSRVAAYSFSAYGRSDTEPAINMDRFRPPRKPTTWLYDGARAMAHDQQALAEFAGLCDRSMPELILVEEPWLWPVIRRLNIVHSDSVPIIYSSYNIEAPLFRQLLERLGHTNAPALAEELAQLEADLARRAQGCVAVTEDDADSLHRLGARHVVIAPNGVERRRRDHLKRVLPEALNPDLNYVLYVASAHRPNASGIPDLVLAILEALRPLERFVVAGGVCPFFEAWLRSDGPADLARERLILLGGVTDFCLDALLANAAGIVLPLREGGGSNLKTGEALYSRLPLVATSVAMRGYEIFRDMHGVIIANDPDIFAAGLRKVMDGEASKRPPDPTLDKLLWDNTLLPIVRLVEATVPARKCHTGA